MTTTDAAPETDRIALELSRLVRLATHHKQHGDMEVAHVLVQLVEHGPQRVGEIAQAVGIDPSTVSRKVTALVDAGMVERQVDPDDGRAHRLAATAQGQQRCAHGRARRVEVLTEVLADWSSTDRDRLAELLGRFADVLQEHERRSDRRPGGEY